MRAAWSVLLLLCLSFALPAAPAADAAHVEDYTVSVDGQTATGRVGIPAGAPLGLVVIVHGYGHTSASHIGHLQHLADQGWLAVAMDFRGTGFPLTTGAADTRAAMADLESRYELPTRVLYSVSMGTAVASLILPHESFDAWVNNEGLAMLQETWAGATALGPSNNPTALKARADIEAECGGSPAVSPECYLERSAALHADKMDVGFAVLTHGVNDGLVPYDQGREMVGALRAVGIPTDFYTVVRSAPGGEGTALTGYTPLGGQGLAGHGTESNDAHALTALSFALLDQVLAGTLVSSNAERVVDNELGTLP